ncbi:hypothetical protein BGX20_003264, partial [Mortierella sp. AD010]
MSAKRNQAQAADNARPVTTNGASVPDSNTNTNEEHVDKKFKIEIDGGDGDDDDDDDDEAPKNGKRAGRRKIKIEYIEDKSRRHITFSKRKSGIMKKAYELSTLTGTQVLLLVVSETGLVYTFTTPKLQPLVTKAEGKNLIQACLHAPDKESTPDNTAADRGTPEENKAGDYDDHRASPQSSSHPSPQQSQQPPPYSQQPPQGGYGSSSAMNVPTYPHPYSHIPFPAQYSYPNVNVHYQNPSSAPNYGGGQYWTGPPPQQSPPTSSAPLPQKNG